MKLPKKAADQGGPAAPAAAPRGEFVADVLGVLSSVFGSPEALQTPKFSEESKKGNRFKRLIFTANDKEVKVYTYKQDNHEVALIFVYDPKLKGAISSKIDLCLESFATGPKATRLYSGGAAEEEADTGPAGRSDRDRAGRPKARPPTGVGPSIGVDRAEAGRVPGPPGVEPLGRALVSARSDARVQGFGSDDSQADRASWASGSLTSSSRTIRTSGGASIPSRTWLRSTLTTLIRMSGPIWIPSSCLRLKTSIRFLHEIGMSGSCVRARHAGRSTKLFGNRAIDPTDPTSDSSGLAQDRGHLSR